MGAHLILGGLSPDSSTEKKLNSTQNGGTHLNINQMEVFTLVNQSVLCGHIFPEGGISQLFQVRTAHPPGGSKIPKSTCGLVWGVPILITATLPYAAIP